MLFPFEDSVISVFFFQINRQGFPPIVFAGLLVEKFDDVDLRFQPIHMYGCTPYCCAHTLRKKLIFSVIVQAITLLLSVRLFLAVSFKILTPNQL